MAYSLLGTVVLLTILTGYLVTGVGVVVTPSPVAMVTEGAELWLTCMYDVGEGTLGQLQWKDKEGGIAAAATPTADPPYSARTDYYKVLCNLTFSEVRLGVPNPVHGDTYSCIVYLSNYTQIGNMSTQVSVVGAGVLLTASPSPVIEGTSLTLICSVLQNSSIYASFNFINGTILGFVQLSEGDCLSGTGEGCVQQCNCTNDGQYFSWTVFNVTDHWNNARIRCQINNPAAKISNILEINVTIPVATVDFLPLVGQPLDVIEGNSIQLVCVTSACRPPANVSWSVGGVNYSNQYTVQSVSGDLFITTGTLNLTPSRAISGQRIVCAASNTADQIQSTVQPTLNVKYRPEIMMSSTSDPYIVSEGQKNVSLVCTVTSANPDVSSLVWTREVTRVSDNSVYTIPVITTEHAGIYTCIAVNNVGSSSLNITLEVTALPTTPHIVGVTDVTSSALTVKWTPNDKGDMTKRFNITHECKGCAGIGSSSVYLTDKGDIYSSTLNNLFPGSEYYVNITAINMAGSSSPLELIVSTSPAADTCPEGTSDTSTVLLVFGVVLVIVAVTVLGISVFVYRKSRLLSKSADGKENVQKAVMFSNVQKSEEVKQEENLAERGHYQDLDPSDIQKPSPYSCLSEGNKKSGIESAYCEPIQGEAADKHDYIEIKEDDDSRRYANT